MSLNPNFSASDETSPCAKLSFHINAFNGNTTIVPRPKSVMIPTQPTQPSQPHQELPSLPPFLRKPSPGSMMPM